MQDYVRILDSKQLLDEYFDIEKVRLQYVKFDGSWSEQLDRYILHRPDAVCAIVYNVDRACTYFVRQFRVGTFRKGDPWTVELAAGLMDEGEDREEAIRREVEEELGFRPRTLRLIDTFYASPGIITERAYLFYVEVGDEDRVSEGGGLDSENEDIEIHEIPVDELDAFVDRYPIRDAKTLIGLLRLKEILSN